MKYEEPKFFVICEPDDIIRTSGEDNDLTNGGTIDDGSFGPKS